MSTPYEYLLKTNYILLSSEGLPVKVADGSTAYFVDTKKLYIFYKGTWYEQ